MHDTNSDRWIGLNPVAGIYIDNNFQCFDILLDLKVRGFQRSLLGISLSATQLTLRSFRASPRFATTNAEVDVSRDV